MAVAFDNSHSGEQCTGSTSYSTSFTISGSNTALIAFVGCRDSDACSGATYNGVSMTQEQLVTSSGSIGVSWPMDWYMFSLAGTATGSNTFTANLTGGTYYFNIILLSYNGVNQADPFGASASTTGSSTSATVNLTTETDNSLVAGGLLTEVNPAVSGGLTQREESSLAGCLATYVNGGDKTTTTAGSYSASWTFSSADYAAAAIEIKEAAGFVPKVMMF